MVFREISYLSANEENEIAAYIWSPEDGVPVIGVVQIVHGMAEHALRYAPFAQFLVSKGFVVCANDHAGHGKSANGIYGYFGERSGHKTLAKDVYRLFCITKKQNPKAPYILFGHDMGSLVARYVCSLWGLEFDGVILSGTGRMLDSSPSGFVGMLGGLRGSQCEAKMFERFMQHRLNRPFRGEDSRRAWLTRDKAALAAIEADPLIGIPFTYAGIRDILKLREIVSGGHWVARMPKNLPIFLLSGLDDPVGEFGRSVLKVYERLVDADCLNVEIKLYEDARHDLLFELNKAEVYGDIWQWMQETVLEEKPQ